MQDEGRDDQQRASAGEKTSNKDPMFYGNEDGLDREELLISAANRQNPEQDRQATSAANDGGTQMADVLQKDQESLLEIHKGQV